MRASVRVVAPWCSLILLFLVGPAAAQAPKAVGAMPPQRTEAYGRLPLSFEPNQGQASPEVKFLARGPGYGVFLTDAEMVLALRGRQTVSERELDHGKDAVLRMTLLGANRKAQVVGETSLPGKTNYLLDKDAANWHRNIPHFAGVRYRGVYPGIDLLYYGNKQQLEYDFVVAPGADPRAIRLRFSGASRVELNARGDLLLAVGREHLTVRAPAIYQEIGGARRPVAGRFVVRGSREVRFEIGRYDRSRTLVIDPTVVYSTFLGGAGGDKPIAASVDAEGNVYLLTTTDSVDFPLAERTLEWPLRDVQFVLVKLSADGRSLSRLDYLGFFFGLGPNKLSVDRSGNVYLAGTAPVGLPILNAVESNCGNAYGCPALLKMTPNGDLVYSTFIAQDSDVGLCFTSITAITTDDGGNAYLTGYTVSTTFPVRNALQPYGSANGYDDAFVMKLSPGGDVVYSTYLGGSKNDIAHGIAADHQGNAYVWGGTASDDFPTANAIHPDWHGIYDWFITKLNSDGSALVHSTYLDLPDSLVYRFVVDSTGNNTYLASKKYSNDSPSVLTKLDGAGSPVWANDTRFDYVTAISVDATGDCYLVGNGYSGDLIQPVMTVPTSHAIVKMTKDGTAVFSTYWGSTRRIGLHNDYEQPFFIGLDGAGNIYIAGETAGANRDRAHMWEVTLENRMWADSGFPTLNAYQATPGGGCDGNWDWSTFPCYLDNRDVFITKIAQSDNTPAGHLVAVAPADGSAVTFDNVTAPGTTSFARTAENLWGAPPPDGFRLGDPPAYYEISTTAAYTGGITICLDYSKVTFSVEWGLGLYHYENGAWTDITTSVDTATNTICGVATSLSPFAIFGAPLPPVIVEGFAPPLAPLVAEGAAVSWPDKAFKYGRTLPLKLQLLVNGTALTDQEVKGPKIVEISRQGDSVLNLATLDLNTGASNDNGLVFRFSDGSWVYNLDTQALSTGRYVITIQLWDGRRFQGGLELKR